MRKARPRFLLLVQDKDKPCDRMNFRALVRCVALQQCGHFMMGVARVKGKTLTVSGAYGSDGLPMNVDADVFAEAMPVPEVLYEMWGKGGGHNCSGSESEWMRSWANIVFPETRKGLKKRRKQWDTVMVVTRPNGDTNTECRPRFRAIPSMGGLTMTRS